MTIVFLLLTFAGCCLLYLSHRHQGWLPVPLPQLPARTAGGLALLLSPVAGLYSFSVPAMVFAWLAIVTLAFSLLPFVSLLIKSLRRESI
jgi:hypothetical protein